jgi:hypothetical protein
VLKRGQNGIERMDGEGGSLSGFLLTQGKNRERQGVGSGMLRRSGGSPV